MFSKALYFLFLGNILLISCEPPVAAPYQQYGAPFTPSGGSGGGYNTGQYNNNYNNNNQIGSLNTYGPPNNNYNNNYNNNNNGGYGSGGGAGGGGGYNGGDHHHDDHGYGEPKAYEFGYQVKDDYTGTNYNRQEQSDGNQVTGSYRVALPDGRTQIVTYYADWKTGFHADVRYEGEAQYPQVYKTAYNPNGGGSGYNYNNQNYNSNKGQNNNQASYNNYNTYNNQYGPPVNPIAINNMYDALTTPQTYASPNNNNYNNYNNNFINQNNYDSYSNSGYGNKPTSAYGAP